MTVQNEHTLRTAEEVFQYLRVSNSNVFGEHWFSPWVFRGHMLPEWKLVPGLWRDEFYEGLFKPPYLEEMVAERVDGINTMTLLGLVKEDHRSRLSEVIRRLAIEYQLHRNFARLAEDVQLRDFDLPSWPSFREYLDHIEAAIFSDPQQVWIEAQHYGLPTRLLDFTQDPLTALQFAMPPAGAERASGVIWAIDQSLRTQSVGDMVAPTFFATGSMRDERASAQRSVFSYVQGGEHIYIKDGHYPSLETMLQPRAVIKFILDLDQLEMSQIWRALLHDRRTQAHLMPDYGTAAKVARQLFNLRFPPS